MSVSPKWVSLITQGIVPIHEKNLKKFRLQEIKKSIETHAMHLDMFVFLFSFDIEKLVKSICQFLELKRLLSGLLGDVCKCACV